MGHDFERALTQCDSFIRAEPPRDMPSVYVLRARTLMDLDRLNDALGDLQFVIENAPTDAAAFEGSVSRRFLPARNGPSRRCGACLANADAVG